MEENSDDTSMLVVKDFQCIQISSITLSDKVLVVPVAVDVHSP